MYPLPLTHTYFMQQALKEAQRAFGLGEIPVGAIVVANGQIIAKAHNHTEKLNDVTAHAEILAITAATTYLGSKYLKNAALYVTLEPCVMCAGALAWSQIGNIYIGASDGKRGFSRYTPSLLHPKTYIEKGILEEECRLLLTSFFKQKR